MDTYILIHRKKRICTTAIVPICMTDHKVWCMYQLSRSVLSDSLQPHGLQHARLPCPSPPPRACSNSCLSSHLTLCRPLLLLPSILPNIRVFSNESVLHMANILELQLQDQSFQCTFRTDFLQD